MGKITVINPSGREVDVDESALPYLQRLDEGWREKPTSEKVAEDEAASKSAYYDSPDQAAIAGVEGFGQGLSLGMVPLTDEGKERASAHPIISTASNIVGMITPAVLTGGASLAEEGVVGAGEVAAGTIARDAAATGLGATPAGLLSRGAEAIGKKVATSRLGQLAVQGTVEGVGQATGQIIGSGLAGDEVTPESIVDTIGTGALFGLGGGIAARGLEKGVEGLTKILRTADEKAASEAVDSLLKESDQPAPRNSFYDSPEAYQYNKHAKASVDDARKAVEKKIQDGAADFQQWAEQADVINQGIPKADTGELRVGARGGDTGNIKRPVRPQTLEVADSQVVGSEPSLTDRAGPPSNLTQELEPGQVLGERNVAPRDYGLAMTDKAGPPAMAGKGNWTQAAVDDSEKLAAMLRGDNGAAEVAADVGSNVAQADQTGQLRTAEYAKPREAEAARGRSTAKLGAGDTAVEARAPVDVEKTYKQPDLADVIKAAQSATPETVDEAATNLFGRKNNAGIETLFGQETYKKGQEIMRLIQAKAALADMPELSLDALSKMTLSEVTDAAKKLDTLGKYAPDIAGRLDANMRAALGKAAPKLKGFGALDVLGYHKVAEDTIAKLANVHDSAKNIVALWSTMKAADAKIGEKAAASLAKESLKAGKEAAEDRGLFKGFGMKFMARRVAGKAGAAALGGVVGGPLGYVLGWAAADSLMKGGAAGVSKATAAARRAAILNTAKGLGIAKSIGRPAAISHLATMKKLSVSIAPGDSAPGDHRTEQRLVAHRIEQAVYMASSAGREQLADILSPLRAASPEMAQALENDSRKRAEYLAKYAPRKPQWAAQMTDNWHYPQDQIDRFASVYRAVTNPLSVLEDFAAGTLTPDAAAAFRETSPGLFKTVMNYAMENYDASKATYAEKFSLSMLLGMPLEPTLQMVPTLQQNFTKDTPQMKGSGGAPGANEQPTEAAQSTNR